MARSSSAILVVRNPCQLKALMDATRVTLLIGVQPELVQKRPPIMVNWYVCFALTASYDKRVTEGDSTNRFPRCHRKV